MRLASVEDLERVFRECFLAEHRTLLIGGGVEPVYLPSADPARSPHRLIYREDYFASALHEVAHWCLAGAQRRKREDYGYWYSPDGRDAAEQARFELAEVDPQALEWVFSDACGFAFNPSADNLSEGAGPTQHFANAVTARRRRFMEEGLPSRAALYRAALARLIQDRTRRLPTDPLREAPRRRLA